jgi:ATP-dependent RNA helicase DHX8/PRP22
VLPSFAWADLLQVHLDEDEGGILVFLTGQEEIELMKQTLVEIGSAIIHPRKLQLVPVAVYAALPAEEQTAAFAQLPKGTRKVVLATNIAETSVTIPGIRFVVDSGMVKSRAYNAAKGMESLQVCSALPPLALHYLSESVLVESPYNSCQSS